jgi:hypothetical protein
MHQCGACICPHYYVAVQHQCTNVVHDGAVQHGRLAGLFKRYAGARGELEVWRQYNSKAKEHTTNMTIQFEAF